LGDAGTLNTTLNWSWEASQWSTPTDSDHQVLPSYGILNARVEYSSPGSVSHWNVALFATNLLNKYYFIGGVNYASNIATEHYDVGRPREFGGSIQYRF
jgi:iron complex outermembrane recepter protein